MTKKELYVCGSSLNLSDTRYIEVSLLHKLLDEFFIANVCIPKGGDRHPYADVLHEWVEDTTKEVEQYAGLGKYGDYVDMDNRLCFVDDIRIKPSKPAFEYQVAMYFTDGTYEYTKKYFTREEYIEFGFPASCSLKEETKRIRQ